MAGRSGRLRLRTPILSAPLAAWLVAAACADATPGSRDAVAPAGGAAKVRSIPYEVVATYPHDPDAFTQGLLVHGGRFLESTGQYGASSLREVEIESGKVLRSVSLGREEFGEGLALAGGRLFQLTWRSGGALVWDPAKLTRIGEHGLEGEGWGLTFDGSELVQSDGTARLTFRDPTTFAPKRTIQVTRAGVPQFYLNELEWIDGALWANVWMSDEIVRIDRNGEVTGVLDAAGLLTTEEAARADVLNGIAWDSAKKRLYLTGKYWPKLFALELR
jgi:glutamine cyclotransferase